MACTVIAASSAHGYRIITTYIADPARDAVVMRSPLRRPARRSPVRAARPAGRRHRWGRHAERRRQHAPSSAGVGGGQVPVASNTNTTTNAVNRDYAVPTFEALRASTRFSTRERRLRRHRQRRPGDARLGPRPDELHSRARRSRRAHRRPHAAAQRQRSSWRLASAPPRPRRCRRRRARPASDASPRPGRATSASGAATTRACAGPPRSVGRGEQYYRSVNVVKASEDKTFAGRDRRRARLAVGAVGARRRRDRAVSRRTSAPTARCSPAICTRRSPDCSSPATSARPGRRRASCSTASSRPTARCRATRCSTASPRPTRAACSSTRPRTRS